MPTWFRVVLGVAGVGIAIVALKINIAFYSSYGTDADTQLTFTALAIISLAIKLLAPAAAAYKPPRAAVICLWVSFGAAVVFDSLGTAGYVELTYGSKTGEASRYADEYKKEGAEVSRLEAEYKVYAARRPTAVIASELEGAEALAGKCSERRAHLDVCQAVAKLKTELADADERDKRELEWKKAKIKFDSKEKPKIAADPQGAVFERLGSRIGLDGLKLYVALIISVLIFAFFELGGPALVYVALHTQGGGAPVPQPVQSGATPARAPRKRAAKGAMQPANGGSLAALRALSSGDGVTWRDGRLVASQRALGSALGISGATANKILGALRDAGSISTRNVPEGTEITFL